MTPAESVSAPSELTKPVAPHEFVTAMNCFTSGVAVVTSRDDGQPVGATVAAIAPIASDPATVMVSLSSTSRTALAILRTRTFAINILDEDAAAVAGRFATRDADRFAGLKFADDVLGNPVLAGRVAALSCRIVDAIPAGSHWEFRASVVGVDTVDGNPLAYYRGNFAHLRTEADRSVLDTVRARVLALRTDSAHVLDPDELARDLGASRGTILRALSALKSEGLTERVDGVHSVAAVPDEVVDDAYQAKLVIELGVAAQIIGRITDNDVATLRALLQPIRRAGPGGSAESIPDLVSALHDCAEVFVGLAGSESLLRAYRSLGLPGIDRRTITAAIFANISPTGGFEEVVEGLERRDLTAVITALRSQRRSPAFVRDATAERALR
ncbi:hypothetical protein AWC21_11400 [Mycolicibacterium peregrinum]|nr:hypothetical protein AWC21_11400 [Mycolicibacterium peregrinum]